CPPQHHFSPAPAPRSPHRTCQPPALLPSHAALVPYACRLPSLSCVAVACPSLHLSLRVCVMRCPILSSWACSLRGLRASGIGRRSAPRIPGGRSTCPSRAPRAGSSLGPLRRTPWGGLRATLAAVSTGGSVLGTPCGRFHSRSAFRPRFAPRVPPRDRRFDN